MNRKRSIKAKLVAVREAIQRTDGREAAVARRKETHEKIGLGGLVVKAGLREVDKVFLLGVLLDAASRISDGEYRARMTNLGRKGFAS